MQLTGGTGDGHVQSFTVEGLGSCEVSGGLVFLTGGTTTLKSSTLTGNPTAVSSEGEDIELSGISLHNEFNNGFKLTLSSISGQPVVATPDNTAEISSLALAGQLNSGLGTVSTTGNLNVLGAAKGTYGIEVVMDLLLAVNQAGGVCETEKVGDLCEVELVGAGQGQGWKVEKLGALLGEKAAERYEVVARGCTVGKLLKEKVDKCLDEIKVKKFEAKTENEYCIWLESANGKVKGKTRCAKLKMA